MKITMKKTFFLVIATGLIFISEPNTGVAQETSPTIIEFHELGIPPGDYVTDQYKSSFGVTFESPSAFVQSICENRPGMRGGCLGILVDGSVCPGPQFIVFDRPTGTAGLNILTNAADNTRLTARRGGVNVETQIFNTDASSEHFIEIKNGGGFDELKLEIIPDDADLGGSNGCPLIDNLTFNTLALVPIEIDIKPGSDQNSINLCSNGSVPVAILGSDVFDVYDVDTDTLRFADLTVKMVGKKDPRLLCSHEDINFDGSADLVCHYQMMDMATLDGDSTSATLSGSLDNGTRIEGTDVVNIVKDTCI